MVYPIMKRSLGKIPFQSDLSMRSTLTGHHREKTSSFLSFRSEKCEGWNPIDIQLIITCNLESDLCFFLQTHNLTSKLRPIIFYFSIMNCKHPFAVMEESVLIIFYLPDVFLNLKDLTFSGSKLLLNLRTNAFKPH